MLRLYHILFLLIACSFIQARGQNLPPACEGSIERYAVNGTPGAYFQWEIEPQNAGTITAIFDHGDSVEIQWSDIETNCLITVTPYLSEKLTPEILVECYGTPLTASVNIVHYKAELNDSFSFCQGSSIKISPTGDFLSVVWPDGSSVDSFEISNEGIIRATITDINNCRYNDSAVIRINSLPLVDLGKDTLICIDEEWMYSLEVNPEYPSIQWSSGEISNNILLEKGNYTIWVRVEDKNHCVNSDTVNIQYCPDILIPNVFTPNADGENDFWMFDEISEYPDAEIEIFDSWGRFVYSKKGGFDKSNILWDGIDKKNNVMPSGSYFYVIKLNDGSNKTWAGAISIIK